MSNFSAKFELDDVDLFPESDLETSTFLNVECEGIKFVSEDNELYAVLSVYSPDHNKRMPYL